MIGYFKARHRIKEIKKCEDIDKLRELRDFYSEYGGYEYLTIGINFAWQNEARVLERVITRRINELYQTRPEREFEERRKAVEERLNK